MYKAMLPETRKVHTGRAAIAEHFYEEQKTTD